VPRQRPVPRKKASPRKPSPRKSPAVSRPLRSVRPDDALDGRIDLDADWYRVVPVGVRELVEALGLTLRDGLPVAELPPIDRLLVPPHALVDVGHPRALLCSRALADGLVRAQVSGWSLAPITSLTGRDTAGYECAWLTADEGAVHELAWTTEWIGVGTGAWRGLVASRRVVGALLDALAGSDDERWFGLEPAHTAPSPTASSQRGAKPRWPDGPGATRGIPRDRTDAELAAHLREHAELRRYKGALDLFSPSGRAGLAKATEAARRQGAQPRDGERVFAVSPGLGVFWALTADGRVRGLARSGLRFGPGTSLETWLDDLIDELAAAAAYPERLWAITRLGR
jgi:hypothetical protein